jgi:hypothetical protein
MMTKDQQIKALTDTLLFNYDMPEAFAKGLAEFLYDEGYGKLPDELTATRTLHVGPKYKCSNCGAWADEGNSGHFNILTAFCKNCGRKMKVKEN